MGIVHPYTPLLIQSTSAGRYAKTASQSTIHHKILYHIYHIMSIYCINVFSIISLYFFLRKPLLLLPLMVFNTITLQQPFIFLSAIQNVIYIYLIVLYLINQ